MSEASTPRDRFLAAGFWYGSTDPANAILAENPAIASADIHVAAMLGDDTTVRHFIATDPASVGAKSGPRDVEPLV